MKPRILIVDDSLTIRMDLQSAFDAAGFGTTLSTSLKSAREELAKSHFSVIVLDLLLPDGEGTELIREVKGNPATQKTPVLLLTSEAEVRDRIRGLTIGADEYVGKPYDLAYVVARTQELVRKSETSPSDSFSDRILIIDDSPTFRDVLQTSLEAAGYRVASATTGEEGLRMAIDIRPKAMIVDGVLPGIDGPTVIRRLRQDATLRRVPCLLLTGSLDRSGELRALESGADAYVRKEEDMKVILARLGALLRSAAGSIAAEASPNLLGPKRIMAVDDSLTYLQEVAVHVRAEGYDPVLARSGEEALELLSVQPVDCILLDLVMPGLSGHETCRRIKNSPAWRDIPLVMLTAREEPQAMIEGINAGADDYILKSSDFEVLKARLRAQIRRKQFEDENRQIREQLHLKEHEAAKARAAAELAEIRARLLADLEEKNKELESFSYSVSHDLRAPLRAISFYSGKLLEEHQEKLDGEGQRLLREVGENTRKMGQLIDDLLRFARLGQTALRTATVDMAELARSVIGELLGSNPERRIDVDLGVMTPAHGDPSLLRQVYQNLIGNAIKYTRGRDSARIGVGSQGEGGGIVYFVRDNGVGFEMQYAHKLFEVFQRLHSSQDFEGTGVGLALVKRIIERHGGRVWAEGKPGEGATIYFTLPDRRKGDDGAQ